MKKLHWILIVIMLVTPFIGIAIFWQQIPAEVPIHYNFEGEADNYAPKGFGVFVMPVVNIFLFLLLYYLPKIDPKKKVSLDSQGYVTLILLMVAFFFVMFGFELSKFIGQPILENQFIVMFPLLFLILGNYLSKLRPNYFFGVRTPWTLENEEVWRRTHRFTGRVWMIGSLLFFLAAILASEQLSLWMFLVFIVVIVLIPLAYSYIIYRKLIKYSELS